MGNRLAEWAIVWLAMPLIGAVKWAQLQRERARVARFLRRTDRG